MANLTSNLRDLATMVDGLVTEGSPSPKGSSHIVKDLLLERDFFNIDGHHEAKWGVLKHMLEFCYLKLHWLVLFLSDRHTVDLIHLASHFQRVEQQRYSMQVKQENGLVEKTTQLNSEKMQKETEVQKLTEENVRLTALLDKKEAQLLAMNEQCKVPVDLVIDHSVQVDVAGSENAMQANMGLEFQRNKVNLEYLGWVIFYTNGILYPDSVVGTDSQTNMIAGLGVVGWGVGGIESEATMLR